MRSRTRPYRLAPVAVTALANALGFFSCIAVLGTAGAETNSLYNVTLCVSRVVRPIALGILRRSLNPPTVWNRQLISCLSIHIMDLDHYFCLEGDAVSFRKFRTP
jgi:hypothetical protein